jgi:hypothetical protein
VYVGSGLRRVRLIILCWQVETKDGGLVGIRASAIMVEIEVG